MSKITWLHISDLHFRPSQAYDSDTVLKTLLDDVAKCVGDKGLRPDFIVLSGDVAFSSDPEEYRLAHKFLDDLLKITGLSKDRLFPVPGNHDIDHSAITNFSSQAESVLNNQDAVNSILADDQERAVIFRRFRNYEEFFIKEYMGEHITSFGNKQYHYIKRFKTADKNIAIFGLNSSWLSSSTEDCGRLLIGGNQVRAALKEAEGADLRLAVMHHPFDWLKGFDRHEVEPLLCDGCDFILHGHLHQPSLSQTVTPDTNAMIIAAGACYETRRSHNSYNFVQLDLSTHKGTIYFRMYSYNQGGFWTEDTATYRNVKNGMYHFDLPDHFCHLPDGSTRCRISKAPFTAIFQAPPLPQHFVPRPEKSNEIKQHLLNCNSDRLVISALHGLGGIGKTILAAALAHDEDVRKHFSDGILWVTLGQDPDLLSLLGGWIQALGDYKFHPTTPEVASAHLRTLLYDKTALIVVDDVWEFEHVSAFLVGGPSCQMLITTRRAHIADDVNAKLYELNLMTREQCLNLFSARLGKILDKSESNVALDVAESVGRLPLALELAAVRIKRGGSWERLRQALEQEIAQLNYLQGTRRRLEASLNLSFKALYSCNEDLWRKFILLGILPEDAKINASMATTLWNVSETDAEQMLELLWEEALLIRDSPTKSNGQYLEIYRLHDLLHDYALHFVIAPVIPKKSDLPGLGLLLPEANACFLERYQKKTKNSQWHTLPNDSYVHEHLFWHMQKADRIEEINALLQEETPDDKNGWYQVRERLGQTGGFIENVSHAWKLTEKESESRIETGDIAPMVGLETLYALIIASVKNLVSNISPGLLIVLVKKGVWTPKQGMSCALQVPDLKQRDEALKQLSLSLQDPQEALDVAREIRDEDSSAVALAGIVPNLPEPQKTSVLNEAITMARQIEDEDLRAKTLAVIAPKIPRIDGALSVIREIKDELEKMRALIEIVSNLSETKEAIAMVWEIKDENLRSRMLVEIAPILTDPDPKDIIDTVKKGIEDRVLPLSKTSV